jgi:hypothetical protein
MKYGLQLIELALKDKKRKKKKKKIIKYPIKDKRWLGFLP